MAPAIATAFLRTKTSSRCVVKMSRAPNYTRYYVGMAKSPPVDKLQARATDNQYRFRQVLTFRAETGGSGTRIARVLVPGCPLRTPRIVSLLEMGALAHRDETVWCMRQAYLIIGCLMVVIGAIGVALPLLPTDALSPDCRRLLRALVAPPRGVAAVAPPFRAAPRRLAGARRHSALGQALVDRRDGARLLCVLQGKPARPAAHGDRRGRSSC